MQETNPPFLREHQESVSVWGSVNSHFAHYQVSFAFFNLSRLYDKNELFALGALMAYSQCLYQ